MTGGSKLGSVTDLEKLIGTLSKKRAANKKRTIVVPGGTCGNARGAGNVYDKVMEALEKLSIKDVDVRRTGCIGYCAQEPLLLILPERTIYTSVDPEKVEEILDSTFNMGKPVENLLFKDPGTGKAVEKMEDLPYYRKQQRMITGNTENVDPEQIEDYMSLGGYSSFLKALSMTPDEVIAEMKTSGLRGRGGAGFSTGTEVGARKEERE